MQTTLRIQDPLYREAKAEAARAGMSLTKFIEEGLRMRLEKKAPVGGSPHAFRVYTRETPGHRSSEEIMRISREDQQTHEIAKLGIYGVITAPGNSPVARDIGRYSTGLWST